MPRPTFSRRESRQRYARNLLVPGPPAQGGGPPWIPPPSALAVLVEGKKAHGILGGKEPAAPRIDSRKCDLYKAWGEIKSDFPTCSKWQIRLGQWHKLYRGGAARRRGSEASPSGDSKGRSPWRAFGDFPRDGKVTRGLGRSAQMVGRSSYQLRRSSPGGKPPSIRCRAKSSG